jgi:transcriptional regulator with XRE-family HTH domain
MVGMSQEDLGKAIGLTFQQIQKYEHGINRVGTSRLWDLSQALDCPVTFFFEQMDEAVASASPRHVSGDTRDIVMHNDATSKREILLLLRAFYAITDRRVRDHIVTLAQSLSPGDDLSDAPSSWPSRTI